MGRDWVEDSRVLMKGYSHTTDRENRKQAGSYLRMHVSELEELMVAANPSKTDDIKRAIGQLMRHAEVAVDADVVEVFDATIDCAVVNIGFGNSMDFPMESGWTEVYATNHAKIDPKTGKVTKNADGKVQKPPGWKKPDLARLLKSRKLFREEQAKIT